MMVDKLNYILQDIFGYKWYTYVCMYVCKCVSLYITYFLFYLFIY